MPIYIEVLFLFNVYVDALIILLTGIILKEKIRIKKLILSSLIGGLSTIILFLKINLFVLLILEIVISVLIVKLAFNKRKIVKKTTYFYLNSILLGGLILFVNNVIKLNYLGNFLILVLISPIIILFYKKEIKNLKENYNLYYEVIIKHQGQKVHLTSFFDTGNKLIDPYFNKPVILIEEKFLKNDNYFYIPYNTITESGIIKAFIVDELEIVGLATVKSVVVGLIPKKILCNSECLLNSKIMEETNVKDNEKDFKNIFTKESNIFCR